MKAIQAIKITGGALVVVASLNVHAQASDAAVESGAIAASSTKEQSKATKAADRALQKKCAALWRMRRAAFGFDAHSVRMPT